MNPVTVVGKKSRDGRARGGAYKQLVDVVVIDIADKKAAGVARHPRGVPGLRIRRAGDGLRRCRQRQPDIVVVTSGVPRKSGMSRDDLLNVNCKIMQSVTEQVVKDPPNCIIIPVSNRRRDGAGGVEAVGVPARAGHGGMAGVL
jgi:malate dehydrogenase